MRDATTPVARGSATRHPLRSATRRRPDTFLRPAPRSHAAPHRAETPHSHQARRVPLPMSAPSFDGPVVRAPDFPPGLDWLNTGGQPLSLADLRGKVVLLDFWTYG